MQECDLALKNRVKKIFENTKFDLVKTSVKFYISEDKNNEDFEIDICAFFEDKLFCVECKSETLNHTKNLFKQIEHNLRQIKEKNIEKAISQNKQIPKKFLDNVDEIYYGFALGNQATYNAQKNNIATNSMMVWDDQAVRYFERTSKTLKDLTKFELFREFNVKNQSKSTIQEPALKFRQGKTQMFVLSMNPKDLLNIAYVSRRGTGRDESYQRIINQNRLELLTNFIGKSSNLLMPNPIIIAFDKNEEKKIKFEPEDGVNQLKIPNKYCIAWIIDGQHRVYSFKDVDFENKKYKEDNFRIPVVAFKNLDVIDQSEAFLNINYYQKKVDSLLIYNLAASFKYPKNELVWASLLTTKLNDAGPLKGLIQVSEIEDKKPLSIVTFVNAIQTELLGYEHSTDEFDGVLYQIAKFNKNKKVDTGTNKIAFTQHLKILQNFFAAIRKILEDVHKDKWIESAKERGFFTSSTVNALFYVLEAILRKDRNPKFGNLLKPLQKINFVKDKEFEEYTRGYSAYLGIAKEIIKQINKHSTTKFEIKRNSDFR